MDAALLQKKLYQGYAKAALRLGQLNHVYRPNGAANPLATETTILYASFNAEDFRYSRPNKYGAPTWYALLDGSLTQAGDYLVGPAGTFFIAAQQLHLPVLCVECNRQVRLLRTPAPSGVGAVSYGGKCKTSSVDVLGQAGQGGAFGTGWPASILLKGRSEQTGTNLPTTTKNVGWQILLPRSAPIEIHAGDIFLDDLGRRYATQGAEETDLGWRIQAVEEHA